MVDEGRVDLGMMSLSLFILKVGSLIEKAFVYNISFSLLASNFVLDKIVNIKRELQP